MADADLSAFIAESPLDRPHIRSLVARAAASLPPGADVLDAGAGTAPYRSLFAHVEYRTSDWAGSMHEAALGADIVAPLDAVPVDAETFDAVICTQVLEHVPDPLAALSEVHRVLRPGGSTWITVPHVWELHEEPHDGLLLHGLRAPAGARRVRADRGRALRGHVLGARAAAAELRVDHGRAP